MSIKFRKRIKILPGVTLNFSKSGMSTTIGKKGLNVNFGQNGTYLNTGLPGTGLYDRQKISGPGQNTPAEGSPTSQPDKESENRSKPGCFLVGLFIFGIICFAYSGYCFAIDAEGGQFIGLTIGIVCITPLLNYRIRMFRGSDSSRSNYWGWLCTLLYVLGLPSIGLGIDIYSSDKDLSHTILIFGAVSLLLALVFRIIDRLPRKFSDTSETEHAKPGCMLKILFVFGLLCIAFSVYCFTQKAEAGQFTGLAFAILCCMPLINFQIHGERSMDLTKIGKHGILSCALYTVGLILTGFGIDAIRIGEGLLLLSFVGVSSLLISLCLRLRDKKEMNSNKNPESQ